MVGHNACLPCHESPSQTPGPSPTLDEPLAPSVGPGLHGFQILGNLRKLTIFLEKEPKNEGKREKDGKGEGKRGETEGNGG